jgi:hypothetical protein
VNARVLIAVGAALAGAAMLAPRRPERGRARGVRADALALLSQFLPCEQGSPAFGEIAQDWTGGGTTCGYLPSWLLWRLGCREGWVNRSEPAEGLRYRDGENISLLRWNPYFVPFQAGGLPTPGDIYFVSDGPPETEHVGVVVSAGPASWTTADAGQGTRTHQRAVFLQRRLDGSRLVRVDGLSARELQGWIPLDAVPFTAPPLLDGPRGEPTA